MWFKNTLKQKNVSSEDVASILGLAQSNISHIYAGRQQMSLKWAQAFSQALDIPVDEILRRAGQTGETGRDEITERTLKDLRRGFSDSDATPYAAGPSETKKTETIAIQFGQRAGVDVWTVGTDCMRLGGYLKGDQILVDTHKSEQCRAGDVVIAQVYDNQGGGAKTVLRRFEPPALIADSALDENQRIIIVDGTNTVIKGKVVAQWRS
ncbi:helix-turn-helix domain-containing protein [Pacificibacter marinus]|uniref:helix-turn-helix domain-containing protein n=1 Tax=Pacificibacter marinus TaxID=658057 RepID=UPI001C065B8F|nr:helix-turn-helix transcriptional regulator [Pacificibacter marinus]MBU2867037.1 helix-turn-helix transcriptional regulator [Pacificibacter marinus]